MTAHMPAPPITITLVPGFRVGAGRQRARVWVKSLVDADHVEVKVETRDGLAIGHGRPRWQTAARKNVAVSEELILTASGKGERGILIAATLYFADGTSMTGVAAYILNPDGRRPDAPIPGTREILTPTGEKLLEIPLRPGP
jgi:hypothetical protein